MKREYKLQILLIFFGFLVLWAIVVVRLYKLQIIEHDMYSTLLSGQRDTIKTSTPLRGDIVDCNGYVLATSKHMKSVYINAFQMKRSEKEKNRKNPLPEINQDDIIEQFSQILNMPIEEVQDKFAKSNEAGAAFARTKKGNRGTICLARLITDEQANQITRLISKEKLPGQSIWFILEEKRFYPRGDLAAPLIGVTKFDDYGQGTGNLGLEYYYDKDLHGKVQQKLIQKTGAALGIDGMPDEDIFNYVGNRLILTIDVGIQEIAENALRKTLTKYNADQGVVLVQKTKTGEILAMASLPSFSPELFGKVTMPEFVIRNNCVQSAIEPGSVAKVFCFAILADIGKLDPESPVNCCGGSRYFGSRLIKDAAGENLGVVKAKEVFYHSSNVGTDLLAQDISQETYRDYLLRFGADVKTGIDLPGEESGKFNEDVALWSGYSMTSLPIGYEMMWTPIQVVTAVSAIVNNGVMMKPYVVKEIRKHNGDLIKSFSPTVIQTGVVKPSTSQVMRDLLEGVVKFGTGKSTDIIGYRVGGKTGTTKKSNKKEREYIASFIGCLPINDPEVTIYCWVDHPKGGKFYASEIAAPMVKEVLEGVIKSLNLQPSYEVVITPTPTPKSKQVAVAKPKIDNKIVKEKVADILDADKLVTSQINPDAANSGVIVPNLVGLSMREAKNILLESNITNFSFSGSGVVVEQSLEPGDKLKESETLKITFSVKTSG